ncbi:hypothetical protein Q8A67_004327 [Cirrhinus molitorella]|uniref:Natural killer cell receptor 2B4 immunoglobulin domain-containing protein n=1 Tax=Cirrhinus molitorella TaxID=172907 RepID=A0AA88TSS9_9TELE|nr:hypothetical protein Q8A67_004327 [Cirrhinus molitorella]
MSFQRWLTAVICAVFISTGAGSGQDQAKAVGDTVSFRPTNINPPVTSIIWKHRSGSDVVKAIEWDKDDGFSTPNPRFKDITTLDEKTGEITITNLDFIHSGVYTIDINSKEQEQRFTLKIEMRVPKPKIDIERISNPDVVYLKCGYSGTIIWKNATEGILIGSKNHPIGELITVKNTKNPENFYTCTLKNDASEETSDPVYERDLFKESNVGQTVGIVFGVLVLLCVIAFILVYAVLKSVHDCVNETCTCIPKHFGSLNCLIKETEKEYNPAPTADKLEGGSPGRGEEMGVVSSIQDDTEGQQQNSAINGNKLEGGSTSPDQKS